MLGGAIFVFHHANGILARAPGMRDGYRATPPSQGTFRGARASRNVLRQTNVPARNPFVIVVWTRGLQANALTPGRLKAASTAGAAAAFSLPSPP